MRKTSAVCKPCAPLRCHLQAWQQTKECTGCSAPLSHGRALAALFIPNHICRQHFTQGASSSSACPSSCSQRQMTLARGWYCVVLPPWLSEVLLAVVLQSRRGRLRSWLSRRLRPHCLQRVDLRCPTDSGTTKLQPHLKLKYCQTAAAG